MAARRAKVSRRLKPASIKMRVRSVARKEQLPELDEAKTQNLKMGGSFGDLSIIQVADCFQISICTNAGTGDAKGSRGDLEEG